MAVVRRRGFKLPLKPEEEEEDDVTSVKNTTNGYASCAVCAVLIHAGFMFCLSLTDPASPLAAVYLQVSPQLFSRYMAAVWLRLFSLCELQSRTDVQTLPTKLTRHECRLPSHLFTSFLTQQRTGRVWERQSGGLSCFSSDVRLDISISSGRLPPVHS